MGTQSIKAWWKESTVYQIYPPSFCDSNGDGVGDLNGIISKLDYIKALGADIVWLCPIFSSPQIDMGYDISDYYGIHPPYGTIEDVDRLAAELHKRSMKLVLDLVVNHTSDQHRWFQEARSSKGNPYRDWYIWRKPVFGEDGKPNPPNNWESYFGGSAWEYDESSGEYYLHLFAREQPDLNWENTNVRDAVHDIIRFWLERGADGFRMDVINFVSKDQAFPNAPIVIPDSLWQRGAKYYACGPRLHEYLQEIGKILKEYDAFSVGEMPDVNDVQEVLKAVGDDRSELSMIFHFEVVHLDHGPKGKFSAKTWKMRELKSVVSKWQTFMYENKGWNAVYLENHDQGRTVSRFGSDSQEHRALSAKMLATFLGLQSGTVFVYQGQELGMANVPRNWGIDQYRDIETLNHWAKISGSSSDKTALQEASLAEYRLKSRDNSRTPMQWNGSLYAGFSTKEPWISVHDDYRIWNAAAQVNDPTSVYHYWADVLHLRKKFAEIIVYGSFKLISPEDPDIFAYTRSIPSSPTVAVVVVNFRPRQVTWPVPLTLDLSPSGAVVLSNYHRCEASPFGNPSIALEPFEAFVWVGTLGSEFTS
ncbi:hypothetical protein ARAM_005898 [Aspergillus rambellii]|uniref:Glycosyl hydrolase family 13 catalytic domain-containing protein n=1 Tax=Aspergillus rambellii TaxID=308745 RepID=A0A0F8XDS7_9EURO|nr:hypothetical protein ARAM_005898 [Aspergillus rambellii]